jgi:3-hydroxy-9,10-secoandrosta-1,3,5(10)-triene-9,17-dione monooxygenase
MTITTDGSLDTAAEAQLILERVRELVPFLRSNARQTEIDRRVPDANMDALAEAGVFRLARPRSRGGLQASLAIQNEVLSEIARGCPSTSWVSTISVAASWLTAKLPDRGQDEVYSSTTPAMSGVFAPTGVGARVDGGLMVNGRWGFNTGCLNSEWGGFAALVDEPDGSKAPYYVVVPYSEVTILDDWHAMGMSGTGSNSVVLKDVFVPSSRMVSMQGLVMGGPSESTEVRNNPYFQRPVVPVLIGVSAGTPWGIAKGALDVFLERLPGRGITYTNYTNQSEAPITHLQRGGVELKLASLEAQIARINELVDGGHACGDDMLARAAVRAHCGNVAELGRDIVSALFSASGASAIQYDVPIQRYHRDMQSLSVHAFMQPTTSDELFGRVLLGLPPNTTFI